MERLTQLQLIDKAKRTHEEALELQRLLTARTRGKKRTTKQWAKIIEVGAACDSVAEFHEANLRNSLRQLGHSGDLVSKIRDSTLGVARILPYVITNGAGWIPAEVRLRLDVVSHDVSSLSDYDAHLANKVQFLLDTTLGLINIEQNNIIKVLTIVSVVGVPPTLVAGIYGMNFHVMPELDWTWGYPYGLGMIVLSTIIPLIWFRWRGWF